MNKNGRNLLMLLLVSAVLIGTVAQTFGQGFSTSLAATDVTPEENSIPVDQPNGIISLDLGNIQDSSSFDVFLKIDGIPGESTDVQHKNEIEIEAFSWGETNNAAPGRGAGKVNMQVFHFAMGVNKASPMLFLAVANGKHFKNAILSIRRAGGEPPQDFMKWTLTDIVVTSYQTAGNGGELTDQFSLSFGKIEVEYIPQNPDGSLGVPVKAGWDLKANKPV